MRDETGPETEAERLPIYEMLIRWQIASEYLQHLQPNEELGESALNTLINRDFPLIFVALKSQLNSNALSRSATAGGFSAS